MKCKSVNGIQVRLKRLKSVRQGQPRHATALSPARKTQFLQDLGELGLLSMPVITP